MDVDRGQHVLLHEPLGDDDRVLEVVALPRHEGDEQVLAERELALAGRRAVREHVAGLHLVAELHDRALVDERALVRPHELHEVVRVAVTLARRDDDALRVDVGHRAGAAREDDVAGVDGGAVLEAGADQRRLRDEQRHRLALHVRAHQRAVRVVVLEERDQRGCHRDDLRRVDVHVVDGLRVGHDRLALARAAQHLRVLEPPGLEVELLRGLGDRVLALLSSVEVDDLVGDLAARDLAVRRLHEAELRHGRVRGQRADEADVRPFRRLDRAHAPVVGRMDVAHLDGRTLARQAAGAQRRQPAPVREPGQRVRLVHELRELRGAEELLQRGDDRPDVDDRLRRDRVDVLGRHPLADDALHPVQADAERLLDQLADGAQAAVAEVLVLVELAADGVARHARGLGRVVLRVLLHAQRLRQVDEPLDERDDVLRREHARPVGHVDLEPLVELVAADLRQVVALGVEEQRLEEVTGVLERRRLAGPLLLEDLDQRLLLTRGRILLQRGRDEDRVVEELEDLLVRRRVERKAGGRVLGRQRAQQRRHRQLALAVDAGVDDALLVDLQLEPRATGRHEVGREDLLRRILRLHEVRAGAADELRDDDALGAVDDERALVGHHGEVAHEDPLLADLARLRVDEADDDRQRHLVGQVLLTALPDRERRLAELVLAELDGERAGVILDRRDVRDRLAETLLHEPLEGGLLDVDEVR